MSSTFFLHTKENSDLTELQACWELARLKDNFRNDYMLVKIDPPIIGQPYGLGDKNINTVILATRHKGYTLFPVTKWPAFVYVIRILDESIISTGRFVTEQVEMILWGVLYRTRSEAEAFLNPAQKSSS